MNKLDFHSVVKKARALYSGQQKRCSDPACNIYKYYGGKGIRVEYTLNEFYYWFTDKVKNLENGIFDQISIGRIDHSKNYSFDNIEIQTRLENIMEMHERRKTQRGMYLAKKVRSFDENGNLLGEHASLCDAARAYGVYPKSVNRCCNEEGAKIRGGVSFKYV